MLAEFILKYIAGPSLEDALIEMVKAEDAVRDALQKTPIERGNLGGPLRTDRIHRLQKEVSEQMKEIDRLKAVLSLLHAWESPDQAFKLHLVGKVYEALLEAESVLESLQPVVDMALKQTQMQAWEQHFLALDAKAIIARNRYEKIRKREAWKLSIIDHLAEPAL